MCCRSLAVVRLVRSLEFVVRRAARRLRARAFDTPLDCVCRRYEVARYTRLRRAWTAVFCALCIKFWHMVREHGRRHEWGEKRKRTTNSNGFCHSIAAKESWKYPQHNSTAWPRRSDTVAKQEINWKENEPTQNSVNRRHDVMLSSVRIIVAYSFPQRNGNMN